MPLADQRTGHLSPGVLWQSLTMSVGLGDEVLVVPVCSADELLDGIKDGGRRVLAGDAGR
jgi:hypothetical protein